MDYSTPTEIEVLAALRTDIWQRATDVTNAIYRRRYQAQHEDWSILGALLDILTWRKKPSLSDELLKTSTCNQVAHLLREHIKRGNVECDHRCPSPAELTPTFPVYRLTSAGVHHLNSLHHELVA